MSCRFYLRSSDGGRHFKSTYLGMSSNPRFWNGNVSTLIKLKIRSASVRTSPLFTTYGASFSHPKRPSLTRTSGSCHLSARQEHSISVFSLNWHVHAKCNGKLERLPRIYMSTLIWEEDRCNLAKRPRAYSSLPSPFILAVPLVTFGNNDAVTGQIGRVCANELVEPLKRSKHRNENIRGLRTQKNQWRISEPEVYDGRIPRWEATCSRRGCQALASIKEIVRRRVIFDGSASNPRFNTAAHRYNVDLEISFVVWRRPLGLLDQKRKNVIRN